MLAGFHARMGFGGLIERKCAVDHRLEPSTLDIWPDGVCNLARHHRFELDRPGPEGRAGERQPTTHHVGDRNLCLGATLEGDGYMPTVLGERLEIPRHIVSPNHVEDNRNAPSLG